VWEYGEEIIECANYIKDFKPVKKYMKPFFKKKKIQKEYEYDYEFYVVGKEFLAYVIEDYKNNVIESYKEIIYPFYPKIIDEEGNFGNKFFFNSSEFMKSFKIKGYNDFGYDYECDFSLITQKEINALNNMLNRFRSHAIEWLYSPFPYKLDDDSPAVTTSWKFEYIIFEMVRIYKTFDWKKNVMIFYGC
jgi:hypothetical protein